MILHLGSLYQMRHDSHLGIDQARGWWGGCTRVPMQSTRTLPSASLKMSRGTCRELFQSTERSFDGANTCPPACGGFQRCFEFPLKRSIRDHWQNSCIYNAFSMQPARKSLYSHAFLYDFVFLALFSPAHNFIPSTNALSQCESSIPLECPSNRKVSRTDCYKKHLIVPTHLAQLHQLAQPASGSQSHPPSCEQCHQHCQRERPCIEVSKRSDSHHESG